MKDGGTLYRRLASPRSPPLDFSEENYCSHQHFTFFHCWSHIYSKTPLVPLLCGSKFWSSILCPS